MRHCYTVNAVAPDWNLKISKMERQDATLYNAVAPDWNLKVVHVLHRAKTAINAVAPDWNLKQGKKTN